MVTETYNSEKSIIGTYEGKEINFETALSITGFGKYNVFLTIVCGICLYAVNSTAYGVGYILPAAECDMNLSTTDKGLLTAVGFIGIASTLYLWGALADATGRKKIIIISLTLGGLCTAATALSASFWLFAIFQFFSGVFISGASCTLYAYLGEFHNNSRRSGVIAWGTVVMILALLILPGLAWITISQSFNVKILTLRFTPWRLFVLLSAVPSLVAAITIFTFPESPKYLFVKGQVCEALKILKKMYTINTGNSADTFPIYSSVKPYEIVSNKEGDYGLFNVLKTLWNQTVPLFQIQYIKYTSVTCILQFGTFAISSGLLLWYPDILNKLADSSKNNPNSTFTVCEAIESEISRSKENSCENLTVDYNVYHQNIIIGFVYLIGCSLVGFLINLAGKRLLLVVNFLISGVCCILLIFVTSNLLVEILFIGVLVPPGLCVAVVNAAVVDIFPTSFKAVAVSLCLLMGRLGSVVASTVIGYLLDLSCNWTFYSYTILALGCTGLSVLIPPKCYSEQSETDEKA